MHQSTRLRNHSNDFGLPILLTVFLLSLPADMSAQVITDGTIGPAQALSGPDFLIPDGLGITAGPNLFHSFQTFSIFQGETATFTGPDAIDNVISRVTGGEASTIDGLLQSEVGQADFFFINPAGVVFGPNAQLDVPAAFHVSTADELRFSDGNTFSAAAPEGSILSVAEPWSFGYLSPQPANITVNGSALEFAPESTVTLAGGNVNVSMMGSLRTQGGAMRLVGVGGGQNEVVLEDVTTQSEPSGDVVVDWFSNVDVGGMGGPESIVFRGGSIEIADSVVSADHYGTADAQGAIEIEGSGVRIANSDVRARVFSTGTGNGITVSANEFEIDAADAVDGRCRLTTRVMDGALGHAGDVVVSVGSLSIKNGASISSVPEASAIGSAGTIHVTASGNISIEGSNLFEYYSGIYTTSFSGAGAKGGSILINASEGILHIRQGGLLQAGTAGAGDSGGVALDAEEIILDDGSQIRTESHGEGAAGDIRINTNHLSLQNGSEILADAYQSGFAGDIDIESNGTVSIDGSFVEAATAGEGHAGRVRINATGLRIQRGAGVIANSFGRGNAGSVSIDLSDSLVLTDYSFISAATQSTREGSGSAGEIRITAPNIEILGGGLIDNSTLSDQNAGTIVVDGERIQIHGMGKTTGILSETRLSGGAGGNIQVSAVDRIELSNGGQIGTNTHDRGDAGTVTVAASDISITGGGDQLSQFTGIFSQSLSTSSGNGGDVQVTVSEQLEISNGGQISTSSTGQGERGGNVAVDADRVLIEGGIQPIQTGILSRSLESSADGGDVHVVARKIKIVNGGQISAGTGLGAGDGGNVTVQASQIMIDGRKAETPTGIFSDTKGSLGGDLSGDGGDVEVVVTNRLEIHDGGQISATSGFGGGDAGSVRVKASELLIDGRLSRISGESGIGSTGEGGPVTVTVGGLLEISGRGKISSSTITENNAGDVVVDSGHIRMSGEGSILCVTLGAGDAGSVTIETDRLVLRESAAVSSGTGGAGNAGKVAIRADEILIDGEYREMPAQINSLSDVNAQGRVGNIDIDTKRLWLLNGAEISIEGRQTLPQEKLARAGESHIFIDSSMVMLDHNARITAASTGNVPAASIHIFTEDLRIAHNGRITTSAIHADGGPITVQGKTIVLREGLVTTSVEGETGDGGDIAITGPTGVLVLDNGFIQANTAAQDARGGDIFIDARAVIAEGANLEIGGLERRAFQPGPGQNIIQAAAPGGEQGTIEVTAPNLDISGALVNIASGFTDPVRLAVDPCRSLSGQDVNSLVLCGSGGIPTRPDQPWAESGARMFERVLDEDPD